jgi:hypothetical protein
MARHADDATIPIPRISSRGPKLGLPAFTIGAGGGSVFALRERVRQMTRPRLRALPSITITQRCAARLRFVHRKRRTCTHTRTRIRKKVDLKGRCNGGPYQCVVNYTSESGVYKEILGARTVTNCCGNKRASAAVRRTLWAETDVAPVYQSKRTNKLSLFFHLAARFFPAPPRLASPSPITFALVIDSTANFRVV